MTARAQTAVWMVIVILAGAARALCALPLPRLMISDRTTQPLLKADKPWEDFCIGYCTVIRTAIGAGDRWQMWYAAYDHNYRIDADGVLCYAESDDGVIWRKPEVGIVDYAGSKQNNLVLGKDSHGACVFLDANAPANERYKIAYVRLVNKRWLVFGGTSADGIHWTLGDKPVLERNSDTQQTCFHDGDQYRLYVRMWTGAKTFTGKRVIGFCESKTFGDFGEPEKIFETDADDPPTLQFYNPAVAKLRDDLYVMFPSGFYTKENLLRVHAAISRDGEHFERSGRGPMLDVGAGFDSMGMYVGPGAFAVEGHANQFWFYYFGTSAGHDHNTPDKLKFGGGIGRFLLTIGD